MFPRCHIVSFEEAANAEFRAGHADDDDAIGDERRTRHRVAVLDRCRFGRFHLPDHLAGLGVERDDVRVGGRGDQLVLKDRHVARRQIAALGHDPCRQVALVFPDQIPGRRIERLDFV